MRGWNLTAQERAIFDAISDDQQDGTMTDWAIAEEATGIARELERAGWQLVRTESLPDVAPSRGPKTSDMAAELIENMSERHFCVWQELLAGGPQTDEELCDRYPQSVERLPLDVIPQSPQSIRTRRKELVVAGHVEWTTLLRPTRTGRQARVWQAR